MKKLLLILVPVLCLLALGIIALNSGRDNYEINYITFIVQGEEFKELDPREQPYELSFSETTAYGWRLNLEANREHRVREELTFETAPLEFPADEVSNDGKTGMRVAYPYIYAGNIFSKLLHRIEFGYNNTYYYELDWSIVAGDPKGDYTYRIYIDDTLIAEQVLHFK